MKIQRWKGKRNTINNILEYRQIISFLIKFMMTIKLERQGELYGIVNGLGKSESTRV